MRNLGAKGVVLMRNLGAKGASTLAVMPDVQLEAEDRTLVTLARSARARAGTAEGAAVRDTDGRTYVAATVALTSLRVSALQLAVAMAASSGVTGLEAAAVVGEAGTDPPDVDAVRDLGGTGLTIFRTDPAGELVRVVTT